MSGAQEIAMATEIFSVGPVGLIVVALIAATLIAAVFLNYTGNQRKSGNVDGGAKMFVDAAKKSGATAIPEVLDSRERCTILFGTQTGTAERFAKSLKSQLESKYGGSTVFDVIDVEQYNGEEKLAKEKMVFFLMATYGDGEPTDNAAEFYNWLVAQADSATLDTTDDNALLCKDVSFGVFGLGNRQYEHFCAVGQRLQKAMEVLGGSAVVRLGMGDDDDDIDEDFDCWSADLFTALEGSPLLTVGSAAAATPSSVVAYLIEEASNAALSAVDVLQDGSGLNHAAPHLATITAVRELHTAASDRSCIHIEVDISGCSAAYEAGDHVAVFAENSPEVVAAAGKALGLSLDTCFTMQLPTSAAAAGLPEPPAGPVTLRSALSRYADLLSAPSKAALAALAVFATDEAEGARLRELASIEGRDAYHTYISAAKRSLLEVLQDFPSARPSLGAFFGSITPHLQPRYYSISSSPAAHPRSVHITCAVVTEVMPTGRLHKGVASSWLAAATPGTKVPIFLRRSTFKLPRNPLTPVIMVGPGTGFAPFRGFIQERAALAARGTTLGDGVLYFGCRRGDQDFIYKDELDSAVSSGALSALNVALSRQTAVKDYVQHHMAKQSAAVWRLLSPLGGQGYIYVCGDAKRMAKDVHAALVEVAVQGLGGDVAAGEAAVKALADSGRYQKDVW